MKVHEYQAKGILAEYGVPVPKGGVATTATEAGRVAEEISGPVGLSKACYSIFFHL